MVVLLNIFMTVKIRIQQITGNRRYFVATHNVMKSWI